MADSYVYRPLSGLTWMLVLLLSLGAIEGAVNSYSSYLQLQLLNRGDYSEAEGEANDAREQILGIVRIGLYAVTVICFGMWIVRANRNVRALGARHLPITPGWAVGYFFIPILNLFRPYQAMRDMTKASSNPTQWQTAPGSPLLPLWWTLWLVSAFIGQIAFRMSLAAKSVPDLKASTKVMIATELLDIPLCLVTIGVVLLITRFQEATATTTATTASPEWAGEHWKGLAQDDEERIAPENS